MSTLGYAALAGTRASTDPENPPAMKTFIDGLAAIVPAEVLALHSLVLTLGTETAETEDGSAATVISEPGLLRSSFWVLIVVAVFLYVMGRVLSGGKWTRWDAARVAVPPIAFVAWTMAQTPTAFDLIKPEWDLDERYFAAAIVAVVLGVVAAFLAKKANEQEV